MEYSAPFDLMQWIEENREHLKPPVANRQFYNDAKDVIVFVSGGPNARNDYHVNTTEELYFQLQGDIVVGVRDPDGTNPRDVPIKEGQMFLLPRDMPHQPRRPANTIGLIVEFPRPKGDDDRIQWYCSNCDKLVHEVCWRLKRIDKDLGEIMTAFWDGDDSKKTCKSCGTVITKADATTLLASS